MTKSLNGAKKQLSFEYLENYIPNYNITNAVVPDVYTTQRDIWMHVRIESQ